MIFIAKGQIAKDYVAKKLAEVFGEHYLGEVDKKYYVEAPENGEMVQIAIAMTCPKNPVAVSGTPIMRSGGIDFEAEPILTAPKTTEVSEEERQTVADMMRRLGL